MPQLDIVTYLTQYSWTLICLYLIFSLLINRVLPKLQQQLAIRAKEGLVVDNNKKEVPSVLILQSLLDQK